MARRKTGQASSTRIASLVAFVLLVAAALWSVLSLAMETGRDLDELARKRALLARMEEVVKRREQSADDPAGTVAQDPFLQAENGSAAAAQLQDHLVRELQAIGIAPKTVEVQARDLDPDLPESIGRVQITAEFEFPEGDTSRILTMAESAYPALKIDRLEIRGAGRRGGDLADVVYADDWRRLSATLAVSGYWLVGNDAR